MQKNKASKIIGFSLYHYRKLFYNNAELFMTMVWRY